jgi:hypothetical protein
MYIICMSKEDIEQAVADLVEAMAVDMAILEAKAGMSSYGAMRADARRAYETAAELYGNAEQQYDELQRRKRDVPALRERLSSLLAGGNISSERDVGRRVITANDRANYVVRIKNSSFAPAGYKLKPYMYDAIMSGELDHVIAEWLEDTWG